MVMTSPKNMDKDQTVRGWGLNIHLYAILLKPQSSGPASIRSIIPADLLPDSPPRRIEVESGLGPREPGCRPLFKTTICPPRKCRLTGQSPDPSWDTRGTR